MPTACPAEPVDLRGLPAPLPLERVMDALLGDPGTPHRYLVPHEPRPLMLILTRMKVPFAVRPWADSWEIVVGAEAFPGS